eukprot:2956122-Amphidinium_carterae.1
MAGWGSFRGRQVLLIMLPGVKNMSNTTSIANLASYRRARVDRTTWREQTSPKEWLSSTLVPESC